MNNNNVFEQILSSVIILTYNSNEFIEETIESALLQGDALNEIIIGDDFSTDGTRKTLLAYKERYPEKIYLILQDKNVGISKNFNACLQQCRGKYIFLLGGDDVFLAEKVCRQVQFMEKNPLISISYHDVEVFDSYSNETLYFYNKRHKPFDGQASLLIKNGTFCCGCSVAVRNENLPLANTKIKYSSDALWYIQILKSNPNTIIAKMPGVYSRYRRHRKNITSLLSSDLDFFESEVELSLKIIANLYPDEIESVNRARAERIFTHAIKLFIAKKYSHSWRLFRFSISNDIYSIWYFIRRHIKLGV